jgi:V/A-type H+-transporting ATPase subunit D
MAKIRLTKNELKKQKDDLKRFTRYLPTLELKKKQLLQEILHIQHEIDRLLQEGRRLESEVSRWVAVFADDIDLKDYIKIKDIRTSVGNIAGINIPVFEEMAFEDFEIDYLNTPFWIDRGIEACQEQVRRRVEQVVAEKQQEILRAELRITIQRIKLFEEVKIPEARESIRVIQIFLGDQQTAEVVRGKIAKAKIEKKKLASRLT